jgi:hypothetical protein
MAADDTLPIPLDIPWRLAGTTMERTSELDPIGSKSSISLFYYEPAVDSLATDYPTDRVIYLKVLASICPAKLPADPADPSTTDLSLNYRDYLEGQSRGLACPLGYWCSARPAGHSWCGCTVGQEGHHASLLSRGGTG